TVRCGAGDGEAQGCITHREVADLEGERMKRNIFAAAALFLPLVASGQPYSGKPVRMIVPWPAGGTVDGVARVVGPSLSSGLGRPIVVENKAGAGGSIGQAEAAKASA